MQSLTSSTDLDELMAGTKLRQQFVRRAVVLGLAASGRLRILVLPALLELPSCAQSIDATLRRGVSGVVTTSKGCPASMVRLAGVL